MLPAAHTVLCLHAHLLQVLTKVRLVRLRRFLIICRTWSRPPTKKRGVPVPARSLPGAQHPVVTRTLRVPKRRLKRNVNVNAL